MKKDDENETGRNTGRPTDADILRQIDAYGANPDRWSKPVSRTALAGSETIARAASEAAALDRLLSMAAPKRDANAERDLLDRIVAAAERTPRVAVKNEMVRPASPAIAAMPQPRRSILARSAGSDVRRGFAVLAASLVLGLSIGQSGVMDRALSGLEDLTGGVFAPASQSIASVLAIDATGDEF